MPFLTEEQRHYAATGDIGQLERFLDLDERLLNLFDQEGNTLLHIAVYNNQVDCVRMLIRRGAATYATNKRFATPVDLAKPNRALLEILLSEYRSISREHLQQQIERCVSRLNRSDLYCLGNAKLIAFLVSRLLGINVFLLMTTDNLTKYLGHLYNLEGTGDGVDLTGWRVEEFLPLRIFATIELLVRYMTHDYAVSSPEGVTREEAASHMGVIQKMIDYLWTELQTFHLCQQLLIAKESPQADRDRLFAVIANRVTSELIVLPDYAQTVIWVGREPIARRVGHAFYLNIRRRADVLECRIHNLGEGCHRHDSPRGATSTRYAYPLGTLIVEEITRDDTRLVEYFTNVFRELINATGNFDTVYNTRRSVRFGALDIVAEEAEREQLVGNCVVYNHSSVRHRILGASYSAWVAEQERVFLVRTSRILTAEHIDRDSLWGASTARDDTTFTFSEEEGVELEEPFSAEAANEMLKQQLFRLLPTRYHAYNWCIIAMPGRRVEGTPWSHTLVVKYSREDYEFKKYLGRAYSTLNLPDRVITMDRSIHGSRSHGECVYWYCDNLPRVIARVSEIERSGQIPRIRRPVGFFAPSPAPAVSNDPPRDFICPILKELMEDPVLTSAGTTYERRAIEDWMRIDNRDPLTHAFITDVFSNRSLKWLIDSWRAARDGSTAPPRMKI